MSAIRRRDTKAKVQVRHALWAAGARGYGFMMEYPIAQAYADARVQRIYGGTNEIIKEVISRSLGLNKA